MLIRNLFPYWDRSDSGGVLCRSQIRILKTIPIRKNAAGIVRG